MRATEFFNLFPDEMELIDQLFKKNLPIKEIAKRTGQQECILLQKESAIVVKISTGFRHCGVQVSGFNLRKALLDGIIEIKRGEFK